MKTGNWAKCFGMAGVSIMCAAPVWADQWTGNLNVTSTHIEDDSNIATLYLTTTQATVNPAGCSATDGYEGNDPVIVPEMLAITLTAISLGTTVQLYVSSTKCVNNRPDIEDFQLTAP